MAAIRLFLPLVLLLVLVFGGGFLYETSPARFGDYSSVVAARIDVPLGRHDGLAAKMASLGVVAVQHCEGDQVVGLVLGPGKKHVPVKADVVEAWKVPSFEVETFKDKKGLSDLIIVRVDADKESASADEVASQLRTTVELALSNYQGDLQRADSWKDPR
jgi:hypothetical protein